MVTNPSNYAAYLNQFTSGWFPTQGPEYINEMTGQPTTDYYGMRSIHDPEFLESIFSFNPGSRGTNANPYGNAGNARAIRSIAEQYGLTKQDADEAALQWAMDHMQQIGHGFSEASHPTLMGYEVAKRLAEKHGLPFNPMSSAEYGGLANQANEYQQRLKDYDSAEWGREPGINMIATRLNSMGNTIDQWQDHPEQLFLGIRTGEQAEGANRLFGTDRYDQTTNWEGDPDQTPGNQQSAYQQGFDPTGSTMWKMLASWITGGYLSNAMSGGQATAGDAWAAGDASMGSSNIGYDYSGMGAGAWGTDSAYGDTRSLENMFATKALPWFLEYNRGNPTAPFRGGRAGTTQTAAPGDTAPQEFGLGQMIDTSAPNVMMGDQDEDDKKINQGWSLNDVWERMNNV